MWKEDNNKLHRKFTFDDFKQAVTFINQVAGIADDMGHHPEITNSYTTVELWLTTHDAGGVTDKDKKFAKLVDALETAQPPEPEVAIQEVKLFTDGGSRGNPGPSAAGYVIIDMADNVVKKGGVYQGITTNNQAEYQAVRIGLEEAKKIGARQVHIYIDSLLVANQMKGVYKIKNRDLWPIHEAINQSMKNFKKVTFTHVPREVNKLADAEVNEILDAEMGRGKK